jgi:hypothetical protein
VELVFISKYYKAQVPKLWGALPPGVQLVLWGGGERGKMFGRHCAWLKYFTYHSVLVLALNYKQNILSPARVRKVCYSLAELYVISVYLNLFGWWGGGVKFIKYFKGEGARYKSLGTPVVKCGTACQFLRLHSVRKYLIT